MSTGCGNMGMTGRGRSSALEGGGRRGCVEGDPVRRDISLWRGLGQELEGDMSGGRVDWMVVSL